MKGRPEATPHQRSGSDYYLSSDSTDCGDWFACASIDVPACCRICSFVNSTISEAMSTSRIRDSDDWRFSWKVERLFSVCSRRFCTDPNVARAFEMFWMAVSIDARLIVPLKFRMFESTEKVWLEPNSWMPLTAMVWPSSAPIW